MRPLANTGTKSSDSILVINQPVTQIEEVFTTDPARQFMFGFYRVVAAITSQCADEFVSTICQKCRHIGFGVVIIYIIFCIFGEAVNSMASQFRGTVRLVSNRTAAQ